MAKYIAVKFARQEVLYNLARSLRSRNGRYHYIANWFGRWSGMAQSRYVCYICDRVIDTESSRYPMTKHVKQMIENHAQYHLDNSLLIPFI